MTGIRSLLGVRRFVIFAFTLVPVFAFTLLLQGCGGFIDSMMGLMDVQSAISERYDLDDVHVHLYNNETLTVTIFDSNYNRLEARDQAESAIGIAEFTLATYVPPTDSAGLATIAINFAKKDGSTDEQANTLASFSFSSSLLPKQTGLPGAS
ncbi:MAG: hypothetical protein O7H39_15080 [Gammaproteobacteria bacterium]|nr:hypothetical protein [Gammaproteobacteria bacterium]